MKVQEVIMKAIAGKLKWVEAAEILGVTDRTMRRWRDRLEADGYDGLYDYRRKRPSPKRLPLATLENVLRLYQEKYFDLNIRHFHEKLTEVEGVAVSYTWVRLALQAAGLVKKERKPVKHRKRRPRRKLPGMLLHIDGSEHEWFQDGGTAPKPRPSRRRATVRVRSCGPLGPDALRCPAASGFEIK